MNRHYDIAVLGGGLAGMSALYHLSRAGKLVGRRVALVDPERKSAHDRTWSFWEIGEGPFESVVYYRWPTVSLHNSDHHCTCVLAPYTYKLIRSNDWYAHVNAELDRQAIERIYGRAENIENEEGRVRFTALDHSYTADLALSSLPQPLDYRELGVPYLDQHFRGWYLHTPHDAFDPGVATLMDFRTPQEEETRFFYVLPFSPRYAMVEVAIFSNRHLSTPAYDRLIENYLRDHWSVEEYRVEHTEQGNIPMTTYDFPRRRGNLIHIGLGGGAARASTGYTFFGLQRQLSRMARHFPQLNGEPAVWPARHQLYDATLLRILQDGKLAGADVFVDLFRRNPGPRVLDFLNGDTSLWQEVQLMSTTRIGTFGSTFLQEVKKMILG